MLLVQSGILGNDDGGHNIGQNAGAYAEDGGAGSDQTHDGGIHIEIPGKAAAYAAEHFAFFRAVKTLFIHNRFSFVRPWANIFLLSFNHSRRELSRKMRRGRVIVNRP